MSEPVKRNVRTLWLILAVCAAPVVAAYAAYYLMPARESTRYGELLPTQRAPMLSGVRADGRRWTLDDENGHWVMIVAARAACDTGCAMRLHASRQVRTMQGRERNRVVRIWLATGDGTPAPTLLAEHPDLEVVRADPRPVERLAHSEAAIYLVDPLGNQVLAWPADPDIKAMARDLATLLRASRIG